MNQNPLFSIVTVCYNSEKTISRTIESILAQTFTDYEYIIVDGMSKDKTLDIINQYEPLFKGRMKIKSEPDKGIYNAFNKGIQRAIGKYIWIVNSDDFIEPNALIQISLLIKKFPKYHLPIISASMNFINLNGEISNKYISNEEFCKSAYETFNMGLIHPATLVPKKIYESIGLFDENFSIMADIDWFRRAYDKQIPILFSDNIITNMCYGGISTTAKFNKFYNDRKLLYHKHVKNYVLRKMLLAKWIITHLYILTISYLHNLKNK